jgi:hypothetical protein
VFECWESEELLDTWRAIANPSERVSEILGGDVQ